MERAAQCPLCPAQHWLHPPSAVFTGIFTRETCKTAIGPCPIQGGPCHSQGTASSLLASTRALPGRCGVGSPSVLTSQWNYKLQEMCWTSHCGNKQYFIQLLCNFLLKPATKIKPPTPRTFVFCKQQLVALWQDGCTQNRYVCGRGNFQLMELIRMIWKSCLSFCELAWYACNTP